MAANAPLYLAHRIAATITISSSVGTMLNSMKRSRKLIPEMPRSLSRDSPPVQVREHVERGAAHRALGDAAEDHVAQLAHQHVEEAQAAVGEQQHDRHGD